MSQWTHISGIFRVDAIPQMGITPNITAIFGRPSTRFMGEMEWEGPAMGVAIPNGSEGSMQYERIQAGTGLVWETIAVWGDLRDFGVEKVEQIDAWFERIINASRDPMNQFVLRAAQLLVEVEGGAARYMLLAEADSSLQYHVRRIEL